MPPAASALATRIAHQASSPSTGCASHVSTARKNDLEAHQRDEQDQHAARLALGRDDQVGDEHADQGEHHAVQHRVLHDQVVAVGTAAGSVTPWKVAAPSSAGVRNGRPIGRVVDRGTRRRRARPR